jgi:hypothetical protein
MKTEKNLQRHVTFPIGVGWTDEIEMRLIGATVPSWEGVGWCLKQIKRGDDARRNCKYDCLCNVLLCLLFVLLAL